MVDGSIARARETRETGNSNLQTLSLRVSVENWKLIHSASYTQPIGAKISKFFSRGGGATTPCPVAGNVPDPSNHMIENISRQGCSSKSSPPLMSRVSRGMGLSKLTAPRDTYLAKTW